MTVDYIAGIAIFLLAVIFVFNFVYGLFVPFQSGSDKTTLAADRVSTILIEQMLHADSSGTLNVIDQGKLYNFNSTQLNYSNTTTGFVPCASQNPMSRANYNNALCSLGLFVKQTVFDLNVSVVNLNSTDCTTNWMNQGGPALPNGTDTAQTKRLVLILNSSTGYNQTAILCVRVW